MTSLQNNTSRYYTLCNCMGSLIYEEHQKAFSAAVEETEYVRAHDSFSEFNKKVNGCLELVVKLYPESNNGVSTQMWNAANSDQFYIHGPVGKGLNIDKYNSNGLHIIFVGGTGILPFMDLFACIGRKILSENDPRYSLFPDEHLFDLSDSAQFIVYAYYPTRADCIGIELLENIEKLYQKYGKKSMFRLNLIFTRDGGKKDTNDQIVDILSDYKNSFGRINKLWVCGPPKMSTQFQKLMPKIKENTGLGFEDFQVL